jgi:hypothetical protein
MVHTVGKKTLRSVPFRFTGNEQAEKMASRFACSARFAF